MSNRKSKILRRKKRAKRQTANDGSDNPVLLANIQAILARESTIARAKGKK